MSKIEVLNWTTFFFIILENGRVVFSLIEYNNGIKPDYILDGMESDVHGNLYMAANGGSRVIVFNPEYMHFCYSFMDKAEITNKFHIFRTMQVVMNIQMPATQIASMRFGGPNLDILFVTTSNKDGKQPEGSGYVYKITGLCAKGYPSARLNLCKEACVCWKPSSSSRSSSISSPSLIRRHKSECKC